MSVEHLPGPENKVRMRNQAQYNHQPNGSECLSTAEVGPKQSGSVRYLDKLPVEGLHQPEAGSACHSNRLISGQIEQPGGICLPSIGINRKVHPEGLSGTEHNCAEPL